MNAVNYISALAIPLTIISIICYGMFEKKKVFDLFLEGAEEGLEVVKKMLPTLIGLFVSIGLLRTSGILDKIIMLINPVTNFLKIPNSVMPLMMLRPVSGSAAMAIATEIMSKYGVDSAIGLMSATIMGATETTLYTIAVYSSSVEIKKTRFVLWVALIGDLVGMIMSIIIWRILL